MAFVLNQTKLRVTTANFFGQPQAAVGSGFVKTDGTTPLTANWNAGAFAITSLNSEDCLQAAEYGVVANGSLTVSGTGTDQTAAFVTALTAAVTQGKKLKLPSGVIKFTQNVVIPDVFGTTTFVHINIEGAGVPTFGVQVNSTSAQAGGTVLKFWTGAGIHGLSLTPTNSLPVFTLRNIEIQGPDTDVTATSGNGIDITGAQAFWVRCAFENVDVNHFRGGKGYNIASPENGTFLNCSAEFCDVGFSFNTAANAHQLFNVQAQLCATRGIEILDSTEVNIYGGLIQANPKNGIYVNGSTNITISGVHFESNNSTGPNTFYPLDIFGTNGHSNTHVNVVGCRFATANDILNIGGSAPGVSFYCTIDTCRFAGGGPTVGAQAGYTLFINSSNGTISDAGLQTTQIGVLGVGDSIFGNNLAVKNTLGVGMTTAPAALVDIGGTSGAVASIKLSGSTVLTGVGSPEMANVAGFGLKTQSLQYDFRDNTNTVSRLFIDSTGNVGFATTAPTRTLDLNGVERWRGIAAPAVSEANSGTIYFDSASNKLKASLNGGAYVDLIGSGGVTGSGVANKVAYWTSATNLTNDANVTFGGANTLDVSGNINISTIANSYRIAGVDVLTLNTGTGVVTLGVGGTPAAGISSTLVGFAAGLASTGGHLTAVGQQALRVATGANSTAVGEGALSQTVAGTDSSALGFNAGLANTTGSNNVFVGSGADASAGNLSNAVAIGYQASVAASNSMVLGNASMKVGIRTSTPAQVLDVNGALATRQTAKALANGLNSDIAVADTSWVRITGPTGAFSVGGFTGGTDGRELKIYNTTAQTMTIVNEDASSAAVNRIKTLTGGNVVLRATATSAAQFCYDDTDDRWILMGTN